MSKSNKKPVFRPFAPIAKEMQKAASPAPRERVTHSHFIRYGTGNAKHTIPKTKDWAFRQPKDGRSGKATRAKQINLKPTVWSGEVLHNELLIIGAGTPECRWTISINTSDPGKDEVTSRPPTARDILYILAYTWKSEVEQIEIEWNESYRVIHIIDDMSKIITSPSQQELGTPLNDR